VLYEEPQELVQLVQGPEGQTLLVLCSPYLKVLGLPAELPLQQQQQPEAGQGEEQSEQQEQPQQQEEEGKEAAGGSNEQQQTEAAPITQHLSNGDKKSSSSSGGSGGGALDATPQTDQRGTIRPATAAAERAATTATSISRSAQQRGDALPRQRTAALEALARLLTEQYAQQPELACAVARQTGFQALLCAQVLELAAAVGVGGTGGAASGGGGMSSDGGAGGSVRPKVALLVSGDVGVGVRMGEMLRLESKHRLERLRTMLFRSI